MAAPPQARGAISARGPLLYPPPTGTKWQPDPALHRTHPKSERTSVKVHPGGWDDRHRHLLYVLLNQYEFADDEIVELFHHLTGLRAAGRDYSFTHLRDHYGSRWQKGRGAMAFRKIDRPNEYNTTAYSVQELADFAAERSRIEAAAATLRANAGEFVIRRQTGRSLYNVQVSRMHPAGGQVLPTPAPNAQFQLPPAIPVAFAAAPSIQPQHTGLLATNNQLANNTTQSTAASNSLLINNPPAPTIAPGAATSHIPSHSSATQNNQGNKKRTRSGYESPGGVPGLELPPRHLNSQRNATFRTVPSFENQDDSQAGKEPRMGNDTQKAAVSSSSKHMSDRHASKSTNIPSELQDADHPPVLLGWLHPEGQQHPQHDTPKPRQEDVPGRINMIHQKYIRTDGQNWNPSFVCGKKFSVAAIPYDDPLYAYGGTVVRIWFSDIKNDGTKYWRKEDCMLCNPDICSTCNDIASDPREAVSPTGGLPFVHAGIQCSTSHIGYLIFEPLNDIPPVAQPGGIIAGNAGGYVGKVMPANGKKAKMVKFCQGELTEAMVCSEASECDCC